MTSLRKLAPSTLLSALLIFAPALAAPILIPAGAQTGPADAAPTDFSAQRQEGRGGGQGGGRGGGQGGGRGQGGGQGGGHGGGRGGGQQFQQQRVQQPQRIQQPRVQQQQRRQEGQGQRRQEGERRQDPQRVQQQQQRQQQQRERQDQQRAQRERQQQQRQERQQQQRQNVQQQRERQQDRQQGRQQDRQQDRQNVQQQQRRDEGQRRKNPQQVQRDRQEAQRNRLDKRAVDRVQRQRAQQDRMRERAGRSQAARLADTQRAKARADRRINNRVSRDVARNGRFSARYRNANYSRVRYAGWSPARAWRRGLYAGFVPWGIGLGFGAAVFWPYAYVDLFNYTFWPYGYYSGYWAYAYDDFFDGIWWAEEPAYVAEPLAYAPVPGPAPGGPAPAAPLAAAPAVTGVPAPRRQAAAPAQPTDEAKEVASEGACSATGSGLTAWPFDKMQSLNLSADQVLLLEGLRDASQRAADALRDSCPRTQPRNPIERLQAMRDRLDATLEALKIVRPSLETFHESLSPDQRKRFEAMGPKLTNPEAPDNARTAQANASACGSDKPGLANFPIEKIQEAVAPTDDQLDLLDKLEDATFKAVDIMKAACPEDPPASPGERLAQTQTRIEAMVQAAQTIQPALEDFYSALNDQQKAAFGKMKS